MKDTPTDLPPCPITNQCLQFIDELNDNTLYKHVQNEKLLTQLREHAATCPTCMAIIASTNQVIAAQRHALRTILDEGEHAVPSTASRIMAIVRLEQQKGTKTPMTVGNYAEPVSPVLPLQRKRELETPPITPTRRRFRGGLSALVAVAVILIASLSLLSYLLPHQYGNNGSSSKNAITSTRTLPSSPSVDAAQAVATTPITTPGWSAVVMTYRINGTTVIANYDPVLGKSNLLTTSPYAVTSVAGVSHHGDKVLYSVYDGFKTSYYLYPQATAAAFYTTSDKISSAVWSTDDDFVFINTSKGIAQVNVQSHNVTMILSELANTTLNSYRDGFLYFVKSYNGRPYSTEGTLERASVTNGDIQQVTPSTCQRGGNFWLSPGGITVYYNCLDQPNSTLYSVDSDGANPSVFRFNAGSMIGYVEDGSPLTITNINSRYQVEQLNLSSAFKDAVLLNDVAPGAAMVTAANVAVAPYGNALVAKGTYNDAHVSTEKLWYYDLLTGKNQQLNVPRGARSLDTIGWDKLQVA